MSIHKVVFAGFIFSVSLAQANPVVTQQIAQSNPIDSVASIVEPMGKELVTLTTLPAKPAALPANELVVVRADSASGLPVVTNAAMARQVQLEVDAPAASAAASTSQPIQENSINIFLLAGLMIGAIMLRRRAE